MDKKPIQITEQDVHFLVEEAVKQYMIQEGFWDTLKGGAQALTQMGSQGLKKAGANAANAVNGGINNMKNKMTNAYNTAATKVGKAYDNAKQTSSNVVNTVKAGAANANIQAAKNNAIKALNNFLVQAQRTPGVAGTSTIQAVEACIKQLNSAGSRSTGNFTAWKNQTMGA